MHGLKLHLIAGASADHNLFHCLQAYLLFGDVKYLEMFSTSYRAAMHGLKLHLIAGAPADSPEPPPWLVDVHMDTGKLSQPWVSSLSAFWPGLQALAGRISYFDSILVSLG